jgi:hypothetical protein
MVVVTYALTLIGCLMTLSVPRLYSVDYYMIYECGAAGGLRIGRGNQSTRTKPSVVQLTRHDLGSNPGRRGGKLATNLPSYGTARLSWMVFVLAPVCAFIDVL